MRFPAENVVSSEFKEESMAKDVKDVGDLVGNALGSIAREALHGVSSGNGIGLSNSRNGALSGSRGVLAGAALATAAPLAAKGAGKLVRGAVTKRLSPGGNGSGGAGVTKKVTEKVTEGVKDTVGKKVDQAGGASGIAAEAGKGMLPGGGGADKSKKGTPGVGKGRRMPVQQEVDIGVPLSTAYNQFTQFEEWPQFMHRLEQATQEDDCTVSFKTKIWAVSKEFEASIVEQRPDERIMWTVTKGITHTGVVTFHELSDRLTRVQVTLDVQPGSLLEKAARGMRHIKRAVRADLARYKAFIEMQEVETGAWRGVIHDGELVEEHDESYDRDRDYADFDDIYDTESSHSPPPQSGNSSKGSSRSRRASSGSSSSGRGRSKSSGRSRSQSGGGSRSKSSGRSSRSQSSGRSRSQSSGRGRSSSSGRSGSSSRGRSGTSGRSGSGSSRKRS
jgi:uncharacterized membrane protein